MGRKGKKTNKKAKTVSQREDTPQMQEINQQQPIEIPSQQEVDQFPSISIQTSIGEMPIMELVKLVRKVDPTSTRQGLDSMVKNPYYIPHHRNPRIYCGGGNFPVPKNNNKKENILWGKFCEEFKVISEASNPRQLRAFKEIKYSQNFSLTEKFALVNALKAIHLGKEQTNQMANKSKDMEIEENKYPQQAEKKNSPIKQKQNSPIKQQQNTTNQQQINSPPKKSNSITKIQKINTQPQKDATVTNQNQLNVNKNYYNENTQTNKRAGSYEKKIAREKLSEGSVEWDEDTKQWLIENEEESYNKAKGVKKSVFVITSENRKSKKKSGNK